MDDVKRGMLEAVFQITGTDQAKRAGMWSIGEALGLSRGQTEDLAMGLVAEGFLEIKSLSGALVLTAAGLESVAPDSADPMASGPTPVIWADQVEAVLDQLGLAPAATHDLKVDLAVLRLQATRNQPLPGMEAALRPSLRQALEAARPRVAGPLMAALEKLSF